jgi:DNA-binding MarR family transcriptional regulator
MVNLFGTLGFSAKKFLAAIPAVGQTIERAVVYTAADKPGDSKKSETAFREVREALAAIVIRCEHRRFSSPWDFGEIVRTLIHDLSREDPRNVIFNLTGGPKTMTVAATIACLVHGIRVLYVPEEAEGLGTPFALPLLRIRYSEFLTGTQAQVLAAVKKHEPRSLDQLAAFLRRSNATITFHAQRLEEIGALTFLLDPANRLTRSPRLTLTGEIMLLAEEALAKRNLRAASI